MTLTFDLDHEMTSRPIFVKNEGTMVEFSFKKITSGMLLFQNDLDP